MQQSEPGKERIKRFQKAARKIGEEALEAHIESVREKLHQKWQDLETGTDAIYRVPTDGAS